MTNLLGWILLILAVVFNRSYTTYFGSNLLPGSIQELFLDIGAVAMSVAGCLMSLSDWRTNAELTARESDE